MNSERWCRISLAGLLVLVPLGGIGPAHAAVPENCVKTGQVGDPERTTAPWSQMRMQSERVWPLTTGASVIVAVIDSGIDAKHEQLQGQVVAGPNLLGADGGPSTQDCTGHGTQVAGIIGAKPVRGLPFHGVAPGVQLLSIRATDTKNGKPIGNADQLAAGIRAAVNGKASVINISATTDQDVPSVREAVEFALANDVVVVAAAGNDQPGTRPEQAAKAVYWPARYEGVLAVAATTPEDKRGDASHSGAYVDIAAPGQAVVTTGANGPLRYAEVSGTSFAAPFVAGTAALIRAYHPKLSGGQVVARILATADIPPQGRGSSDLGAGIVNPYAAVTAVIPAEGTAATPTRPPASPVAVPALPVPPDRSARNRALTAAAIVSGLALLLVIAAVVVPRGRGRRWQPRRPRPNAF